jgi:hypothetical protein
LLAALGRSNVALWYLAISGAFYALMALNVALQLDDRIHRSLGSP